MHSRPPEPPSMHALPLQGLSTLQQLFSIHRCAHPTSLGALPLLLLGPHALTAPFKLLDPRAHHQARQLLASGTLGCSDDDAALCTTADHDPLRSTRCAVSLGHSIMRLLLHIGTSMLLSNSRGLWLGA